MRLPVRYFAPGPVYVDPKIRRAMTQAIVPHRNVDFRRRWRSIGERLETVFRTRQKVFVVASSATEGIEARWRRHRNLRKQTEAWAASAGFQYASDEDAGSPTVSCLKTPSGLAASDLVDRLAQQGFVVGSGYGRFKDSSFRIGHMAEIGSGASIG